MQPDDLVQLEAIRRCKYAYLRCLDLKDWPGMAEVLTEDATADYGGAQRLEGRDAILAFLEVSLGSPQRLSSHRVHHPEIELTGDDRATGRWALDDTVLLLDHELTLHGSAYYDDRYRRGDDGRWRIEHTGYRRIFEEVVPRRGSAAPTLTASWWGTDGRSRLEG